MGTGASKYSEEKKLLLKTLDGHKGGINCMDVVGDHLLTGSDDKTARVWHLTSFECKVVLEGHRGYVSSCKLWQETYALTGSFDKTIRKWNISTGNCILKLQKHSGVINRMLLFGSFLFSSSYDSTTVCWDLRNGEASRVFRGHGKSVLPLEYLEGPNHDPGGANDIEKNKDSIVTGSMDETARLWEIWSAKSLRTFRGHRGAILCLTVDRENKMLFTGSTDNTIRKWNLLTGSALKVFKGHEGSVLCLQLHHRLLYSASLDATARSWVAEFGDTTRKYVSHEHMISDMTYYQGTVFTGSGDGAIRAFDAKSGTLKRTLKGHKYQVNSLIPHHDVMLSGSYDGNVKVWNIKTLVKDRTLGAGTPVMSSMRSSVTQKRRGLGDLESGDSYRRDQQTNGRKPKKTIEEIGSKDEQVNTIRGSSFKGEPRKKGGNNFVSWETRNGNNNSYVDEDVDVDCLNGRLQNVLEKEEFWTTSFNQNTVNNLKNIAKSRSLLKNPVTPSTASSSRNNSSTKSDVTSASSRPQTDASSRPSTRSLTKRESSDLLKKKPRKDSNDISTTRNNGVNSDIALVDEEMRMSAFDTSSCTSGYRTADESSPVLSSNEPQENDAVSASAKSRQKTTVSFSPMISAKENKNRGSATSRNSKIPTSSRSSRRQSETRESDKSLNPSSSSDSPSVMSQSERKKLEQEILDMV